jgi:hypothetical protein
VILISALVVAAAIAWAARHVVAEMRAGRRDARGGPDRTAALLALFAPALSETQRDPRAFLIWQPIARAARQIFPEEFAALDRAMGGTFPFSAERIEAAHAAWTADWLAWEHAHDNEYKVKAATAQHELAVAGGSEVARARLDAVEREKLDLYQRRYADYVRTAKALQALTAS